MKKLLENDWFWIMTGAFTGLLLAFLIELLK